MPATEASGTKVTIAQTIEAVCGVLPAGVSTAVASVESVATGTSGAGYSIFRRATGSWTTDGFVKGQTVTSSGFADTDTNGNWVVNNVTTLDLEVVDPSDSIANEASEVAQEVQIALEYVRNTTRNINPERDELESEEVRPSGQIADVRHGSERVPGSIGFEMALQSYDLSLEGVLNDTWTNIVATSSPNIQVIAASQRFVRASGSWTDDGYRPGDLVVTSGFTNSENNGTFRVISAIGANLDCLAGSGLVDEASAASRTVSVGNRLDLRNTFLRTYAIERSFEDLPQHQMFLGMAYDEWQVSLSPESIAGGTLTLVGVKPQAMSSTSASDITKIAAPATSPFAQFDGKIFVGGTEIGVITSMDFTVANGRQLSSVVGSRNSPGVYDGRKPVTGTVSMFFADATHYNLFINETETSIWVRLNEPGSSPGFMNIVFPRVKFMGASMDPPQEGPVVIDLPFRALASASLAYPGGTVIESSMSVQRSN